MHNKSTLSLMEQIFMLLIFAFTSVLCLQAFVWSHNRSLLNANMDCALLETQNIAELVRYENGDLFTAASYYGGACSDTTWQIFYDEAWNQVTEHGFYILKVEKQATDHPLLGSATITTAKRDGQILSSITLMYQEEVHYE